MEKIVVGQIIEFDYVNWEGKQAKRKAKVVDFYFGSTEFHPTPQWLVSAWDCDKEADRVFAMLDMRNVRSCN